MTKKKKKEKNKPFSPRYKLIRHAGKWIIFRLAGRTSPPPPSADRPKRKNEYEKIIIIKKKSSIRRIFKKWENRTHQSKVVGGRRRLLIKCVSLHPPPPTGARSFCFISFLCPRLAASEIFLPPCGSRPPQVSRLSPAPARNYRGAGNDMEWDVLQQRHYVRIPLYYQLNCHKLFICLCTR